jgi:hypothetical protein
MDVFLCVPSLVEIAPEVPELRLSGVIYHQIPHWPETHKYRYFTGMWHRSWSALFTYLSRNGLLFVCMYDLAQHTLSGCCFDTDLRKRYHGSDW